MHMAQRFKPAARRAAMACCAALLTAGSGAAVASAAPAPAPGPGLPAALVSAVARDLKLTPDQYLHRADLAQRLGSFEAKARSNYPAAFAGAWLDTSGRPIVALADAPTKPAARAAAVAAGFTVKDVAKNETTLRNEKSAFEKWLAGQPAAVANLIRGSAIDTVNNAIAVRVDRVAGGMQLPSFIDPGRIITTAPPVAGEQTTMPTAGLIAGQAPGPAVIGGQPYAAIVGKRALRCSAGFNGTDGAGHVVNITAGHCDPNIPAAGTPAAPAIFAVHGTAIGEPLGVFAKSVLGNHDYSILRINDQSRARFQNNLVAAAGPPVPVTGVAVPVVGAPACKSGSRTGFSCGTVNAVEQSVQVGDRQLTNSFSMNVCALPGDSGGTVVTGTRALGISSASSVADYPICEIPNLLGLITGDVPQLFVQPVSVVLAENPGLRIRTN